jgi:cytoskeleton protein RodZ
MEQIPENNADQGTRSASNPKTSLGGMLREARERLGFSVADVAAQIKFAPRQIEALESDDYIHLPEPAFVRGFVRSYAKILHLDTEVLLAAMPITKTDTTELMPAPVNVPFPVSNSPQKQNLILLGAALILAVIVVGFAVWHFTSPLKQPKAAKIETPVALPAETQIAPAPIEQSPNMVATPHPDEKKARSLAEKPSAPAKTKAVKPPAPTIPPKDALMENDTTSQADTGPTTTIRLVFEEDSWTEITDKSGKILSSQVNPRGSELTLKGHLPLSLVIGHATTTRLYQDGEPVDLTSDLSSANDVARLTLE